MKIDTFMWSFFTKQVMVTNQCRSIVKGITNSVLGLLLSIMYLLAQCSNWRNSVILLSLLKKIIFGFKCHFNYSLGVEGDIRKLISIILHHSVDWVTFASLSWIALCFSYFLSWQYFEWLAKGFRKHFLWMCLHFKNSGCTILRKQTLDEKGASLKEHCCFLLLSILKSMLYEGNSSLLE